MHLIHAAVCSPQIPSRLTMATVRRCGVWPLPPLPLGKDIMSRAAAEGATLGMSAECGSRTTAVGKLIDREPAPQRVIDEATVSAVGTHNPRTQLPITGSGGCDA